MAADTPTDSPLDPRVKTAWRLESLLGYSILIVIMAVALVVASLAGVMSTAIGSVLLISAGLLVAALVISLAVVPEVRYRRWRYSVAEQEIRLREGLVILTTTVVPMARVQHVDTSQGPIMRSLGLTQVHFSTAAGRHTIPGLTDEHAAQLRDRIATLARISDDGGL
jgi:membrane protein YdbS with pleckstrin-like domain